MLAAGLLKYRFIGLFLVSRVVPGTFLRAEEDQVHLGTEQQTQGHRRAHGHAHAQTGDLDLQIHKVDNLALILSWHYFQVPGNFVRYL